MPKKRKLNSNDDESPAKKRKIDNENSDDIKSESNNDDGCTGDSDVTMDGIRNVLNVDTRKFADKQAIWKHLKKISLALIRDVVLVIKSPNGKDNLFRFCEFEYYLLDGKHHSDVFAHCDDLQIHTYGNWYFHHSGNNSVEGYMYMCENDEGKEWVNPRPKAKFRNGTFKGMDLTFGVENEIFGGILIRSIEALNITGLNKNGEYLPNGVVEGPSKTVDKILKTTGEKDISALHNHKQFKLDAFDQTGILHLELSSKYNIQSFSPKKVIKPVDDYAKHFCCSPRVGLTLKKTKLKTDALTTKFANIKEEYLLAPYRTVRISNASKMKKWNITIILGMLYYDYYTYKMNNQLNKLSSPDNQKMDWVMNIMNTTSKKINTMIENCEESRLVPNTTLKNYMNKMKSDNTTLSKLFGWYIGP